MQAHWQHCAGIWPAGHMLMAAGMLLSALLACVAIPPGPVLAQTQMRDAADTGWYVTGASAQTLAIDHIGAIDQPSAIERRSIRSPGTSLDLARVNLSTGTVLEPFVIGGAAPGLFLSGREIADFQLGAGVNYAITGGLDLSLSWSGAWSPAPESRLTAMDDPADPEGGYSFDLLLRYRF